MAVFVRALEQTDKQAALLADIASYRKGAVSSTVFQVDPGTFRILPGASFAYWISDGVKKVFGRLQRFDDAGFRAQVGGSTKDDFRFLRLWWEMPGAASLGWVPFAKGGAFSPYYADVYLQVNWKKNATEMEASILKKYVYLGDNANWVLHRESAYFHPGITWPRRTKTRFAPRILLKGCIFSEKGPFAFVDGDDPAEIFALLSIMSTRAFRRIIEVQLAAADARAGGAANSYEIGIIRWSPIPDLSRDLLGQLANLSKRAWGIMRARDCSSETSHAFALPAAIAPGELRGDDAPAGDELGVIETEIDWRVAAAYELAPEEILDQKRISSASSILRPDEEVVDDDEDEGEENVVDGDLRISLTSWAVGVAFGRFDWRLATGEREAPPEPDPFDPLPAKSPGMLPDGAAPFYAHSGILVDDQGHPHDLARLVEEVLARVDCPMPDNVRRWLQRDFFPFHLQRYSKSRRKAPIYWPLTTGSGNYTLWVYYPSLTSQTLYTAVNDFLEPKLKQVGQEVTSLRAKGAARTRDDDKRFEGLHDFELELIELRDTLLAIAPTFRPNHDDGVQITAAPLWQLFRHKPWQKVLKDTWTKLQKGDYDWAHLAYTYWPDRVREKCQTDKSLAIAHDLEHLHVEPEATPKKARGRKAKA